MGFGWGRVVASIVATNFVGAPLSFVLMATDRDAVTVVDFAVSDTVPARGTFVIVDISRDMGPTFDIVEVDPMRAGVHIGHGSVKLRHGDDSIVAAVVIQANSA